MVQLTFDANTGSLSGGRVTKWWQLPAGMRERRQWAVSTLTLDPNGKPDKRPRRADGSEMDWRNPLQWLTFEEAISAGFPAIGFILSNADPFVVIDLDLKDASNEPDPDKWTTESQRERQAKVYQAFPSYAELSQSGKGLHIILTGRIGGGLNRDRIEVYDQERYMICTGDVVTPGPLQSHPETLERLIEEMGGISSTKELPENEAETADDETLISRMSNARNGEKFKRLFFGPVDMGSENDSALFTLMAFYTRNHEQLLRLFARSVLYRPRGEADGKKGHSSATYHNKYLRDTLAGALSLKPAAQGADLNHGKALAEQLLNRPLEAPVAPTRTDLDLPPGLVGEIARYIYESAPRPMREVAIAGALAVMAGVCGRQFNVSSGVGLNLYITMLAESGMGKEGAKNGADRLFYSLAMTHPGASVFLGPRAVSGQALEKAVAEHNPCFVTFVGEIGVRLQAMLAKRNGDPMMKAAWLGLYTAAVRGGRHQGAFHSKKEDRTNDVVFPAVTIFGESTQAEYYRAISGSNFEDGFIPRFLTISCSETEIKKLNPNRGVPPSEALAARFGALVQYAIDLQVRDQYIEVGFGSGITAESVDAHYMAIASALPGGPVRTSWTRAPMQMFKVAALLAVGRNHLNPTIQAEDMEWASRLVEASINEVAHRESTGDLGGDEGKKVPIVEELARKYISMTDKQKRNRKVPVYLLARPEIIPYAYFYHCLRDKAEFAGSPRGLEAAVKTALQSAVEVGSLQRLTETQITSAVGRPIPGGAYCLGEAI